VATSLLMQASAHRLDREFVARGWPSLKIGIGLNTGMMHVGDMGSKIRRAYTVMGDAVNLGSRLEGITKEYGVGIAVGQVTRLAAPEFVYRELDLVRVKGKNEPVAIFEPLGKSAELDPGLLAAIAAWDTAGIRPRRCCGRCRRTIQAASYTAFIWAALPSTATIRPGITGMA
jgi:adenylate cyclase